MTQTIPHPLQKRHSGMSPLPFCFCVCHTNTSIFGPESLSGVALICPPIWKHHKPPLEDAVSKFNCLQQAGGKCFCCPHFTRGSPFIQVLKRHFKVLLHLFQNHSHSTKRGFISNWLVFPYRLQWSNKHPRNRFRR